MANKKRKCGYKLCETGRFIVEETPDAIITPVAAFCCIGHATAQAQLLSRNKRDKEKKKRHREDLRRVRRSPRAEALKSAQLLARISNADDNGNCTCVTCGHTGRYNDYFDGGHFIAKGSSSYWMLDPRNIHPQCKSCNGNGMKFGNKEMAYTLWMIDKYGRDFVEHMKSTKGQIIKRTALEFEAFITEANKKIAEHKKRIAMP